METAAELFRAVQNGLALLRQEEDIVDAEIFASANHTLLCRLNYTSHILCNGVEEPKSTENFGLGIRAVFKDGAMGFGSTESDLSPSGVQGALKKARASKIIDPDFVSLPRSTPGVERTLTNYHDPVLVNLRDSGFVNLAWSVLTGALDELRRDPQIKIVVPDPELLPTLNVIIGGDIQKITERMAITSFSMPDVQTDETTMVMGSITAMIEAYNAKGTGFFAGKTLNELLNLASETGRNAMRSAIATMSGSRIESGDYTVILAPQAVSELVSNLIMGGLTADGLYAYFSPFMGKLNQVVASPALSIYDDGANPNYVGAKGITCEGLPTGRTNLIVNGVFKNFISSDYALKRLLRDPRVTEKLGAALRPNEHVAKNGFRFLGGGDAGRNFASQPSTAASSIIVTSPSPWPLEAMIKSVKKGVLIGRMWYVYPINGMVAGDFTGTVTADSWIIENGKLAQPLRPNSVRVNDNIKDVLARIMAVSDQLKPVNLWGADEAMYAGHWLVSSLRLDSIAEFTEMQRGG